MPFVNNSDCLTLVSIFIAKEYIISERFLLLFLYFCFFSFSSHNLHSKKAHKVKKASILAEATESRGWGLNNLGAISKDGYTSNLLNVVLAAPSYTVTSCVVLGTFRK